MALWFLDTDEIRRTEVDGDGVQHLEIVLEPVAQIRLALNARGPVVIRMTVDAPDNALAACARFKWDGPSV